MLPAQSPIWIAEWIANARPDGVVAMVRGRRQAGLCAGAGNRAIGPVPHRPLHGRPPRQRQFSGRRPGVPRFRRASTFGAIAAAIRRARPDIDMLALERLLPDLDGTPNPLLALPHLPSPNLSLAVDLDGGFDALLGARQRQAQAQEAPFADAQVRGGRRLPPHRGEDARGSRAAARRLLRHEGVPLPKMGIANVFGDARGAAPSSARCLPRRLAKTRRPSCCTRSKSAASCAPSPARACRASA